MTPQESEQLDDILSRFWKGESSLEEEAWLRLKSINEELPDHLAELGAYFEAVVPDQGLDGCFDDEVLEAIGQRNVRRLGFSRKTILYAAAIALFAIGAWFFARESSPQNNQTAQQEEVMEAWEQTRAALKQVGGKLHQAKGHAAFMNRFEPVGITLQKNPTK